ncbi:uncharacterized protein LOC135484796 [Lineus longissimus]|uniref:uncharacterized protein LOC135484796 n=1 Tax=Lineus longissimus TaxID=88925 RepID=UPI00315D9AF5
MTDDEPANIRPDSRASNKSRESSTSGYVATPKRNHPTKSSEDEKSSVNDYSRKKQKKTKRNQGSEQVSDILAQFLRQQEEANESFRMREAEQRRRDEEREKELRAQEFEQNMLMMRTMANMFMGNQGQQPAMPFLMQHQAQPVPQVQPAVPMQAQVQPGVHMQNHANPLPARPPMRLGQYRLPEQWNRHAPGGRGPTTPAAGIRNSSQGVQSEESEAQLEEHRNVFNMMRSSFDVLDSDDF